eukprot:scaffold5689_cov122-Skeletonema_dohrnii-CCMP3373.AAC.5
MKQLSITSVYVGLLIASPLFFCAYHVTGFASPFLVHQRSHQRHRNAYPCYGTVVAYTPSSTTPKSAASNALQTSSTASYLDSLSIASQSTAQIDENSHAAAAPPPPSVPMDTPARQSLPAHLTLHPFPNKGLGVITTIPISKGEFIGEYKGEIFTEQVKDRRYLSSHTKTVEDEEWIQSRIDRGQSLTGCYVYGITIPPTKSNNFVQNQRIYVDAEDEYQSLWTRFLNHASPPNNNCNPKSVHESYNGEPRVWFVACRDIEVGEELCFDYGDDYWLEGDDVV